MAKKSSRSIESIIDCSSRVESMDRSKVESIDRVDRQWTRIDRTGRLDRFRGLVGISTAAAAANDVGGGRDN